MSSRTYTIFNRWYIKVNWSLRFTQPERIARMFSRGRHRP